METIAVAYAIVWLAVVLYLVRLGRQQRSLRQTIEALRDQLREQAPPAEPHRVSQAA
jgi:CcmD family protein